MYHSLLLSVCLSVGRLSLLSPLQKSVSSSNQLSHAHLIHTSNLYSLPTETVES